jgi:hypothetical protein
VSLRGVPVDQSARLPDGREASIHIGIADDSYLPPRRLDTVALELRVDGTVVAALNTILGPEHESEARQLAREIASGLETGRLAPKAEDLEPYANTIPEVG